jgi:AraC-like DNA-binding protein
MKKPPAPGQIIQVVKSSAFARRVLWHLFSLDTLCLTHPASQEAHQKPGVHIFWLLSGHGTLEIEGVTHDLTPGNCVWFVNMARKRIYRPQPDTGLVKQGFRFAGPAVDLWHREFGSDQKARFFLEDPKLMRHNFRKMWQICRLKPARWEWQVHLLITSMLGQLADSHNLLAADKLELPEAVVRVLDTLATNPFYDWRVRDIVPISGVSYSKLSDLFLQTYGQSLHGFIQEQRLDQAKLLLADDKLSIKQIADQMHFSDEYYFSHFFKRLSGVSPTAFRLLKRT